MKITTILFALLLSATMSFAGQAIVFSGRPTIKISEGGVSRTPEQIDKAKASTFECVIEQDGDVYYWRSRSNTPMARIDAGAFTTYVATNGSGYVRVVAPSMKDAARLMSETEAKFDYVEHLSIGLRSVTYYGNSGR